MGQFRHCIFAGLAKTTIGSLKTFVSLSESVSYAAINNCSVKRIFTIITVLISLSLIGIIFIQLSWIKNMVLLREEQIKHSVEDATKMVGEDLAQHKGSYSHRQQQAQILIPNDFSLEILKPVTVGQRFGAEEINQKLQRAFLQNGLERCSFRIWCGFIG